MRNLLLICLGLLICSLPLRAQERPYTLYIVDRNGDISESTGLPISECVNALAQIRRTSQPETPEAMKSRADAAMVLIVSEAKKWKEEYCLRPVFADCYECASSKKLATMTSAQIAKLRGCGVNAFVPNPGGMKGVVRAWCK
jgi:hypothetical protein